MATFVPPLWSKFGKSLSDLLKKKYDYKNQLTVKNNVGSDLTLESSSILSEKSNFAGAVKATYKNRDFGEFEGKFETEGKLEGEIKTSKLIPNVNVKINATEKPLGKVVLEYEQNSFSGAVTVEATQKTTKGEVAAVVGFDGLSVGGAVQYDTALADVSDFNAGAEYKTDNFIATVQTENRADSITASYFHSLAGNRYGKTEVGAQLKYDLRAADKNSTLTIGTAHDIDAVTSVKGKIDSTGSIAAVVEYRLNNPAVKLAFSSQWDGKKKVVNPDKFGVAATFGDY